MMTLFITLIILSISGGNNVLEISRISSSKHFSNVSIFSYHHSSYPQQEDQKFESPSEIFEDVQKGIIQKDVEAFAKIIARQVYIDLRSLERGYFSANQAISILQAFFDSRNIVNFKFSSISTKGKMPFATGGGILTMRGRRESFQIYVGLSQQNRHWVITQFNVY